MVDVYGRDIGRHAIVEERSAVTAYGVATHLDEQGMHCVRIEFFWRYANDFTERGADGNRFAIRTRTGHGVKGIR